MQTTVNPFQEMQVLLTVVECGSFTAAAQTLDLPKSSVSRRLTTLDLDFALLRDGASDGQLASGAYSKKALDFACFFEPVSHVL